MLAVIDGHAHVLDRVAGDGAAAHDFAHALFHGGDQLAGDHAALDLVDELEAAAARQRLDAQEHLAELAGAAGLLPVAVVALGGGADGLAVGDARRPRGHFNAVAVPEPVQVDAQVQVRQAADDGFVGFLLVLDVEAGVLLGQLVQGVGELLLLAAAGGLDRQAEHRPREVDRREVDVVFVVAVVQHGVEVQVVDLGHRGDVAGHRAVDLDVVLALDAEQVADLERLAAVVDEQLRILLHRALVHAEDAQLAHERVVGDPEHVGDHVRIRVRGQFQRPGFGAAALEEQGRVAFAGMREQAPGHVQQLAHAHPGARRGEAHRHQVAFAHARLERIV